MTPRQICELVSADCFPSTATAHSRHVLTPCVRASPVLAEHAAQVAHPEKDGTAAAPALRTKQQAQTSTAAVPRLPYHQQRYHDYRTSSLEPGEGLTEAEAAGLR